MGPRSIPNMEFRPLALAGAIEIIPRIFADERGYFLECYKESQFAQHGIPTSFPQDNQSFSHKGVLRGLHFQKPPFEQGKLVHVVAGRLIDVIVDLRQQSPTYGQHLKIELDGQRQNMLWVPAGFAHGFITLEDSYFHYKCTNEYNKDSELGLLWNDPALGIDWGHPAPIVSPKDLLLPRLAELGPIF